jgi:hypothetical protein
VLLSPRKTGTPPSQMALALPDIASSLEANDGVTSGRLYAAWFDKWLPSYSEAETIERAGRRYARRPFMKGTDCYALRCSFLHSGLDDIEDQRAQETITRFVFLAPSGERSFHRSLHNAVLQLDVSIFVAEICEAIDRWHADFSKQKPEEALKREAELMVIYDSSTVERIGIRDGKFEIVAKPI